MGLKEALGLASNDNKVRYAIVGLGDIAQEDLMPGVDHTGNSVITALVTSDPQKAKELGEKYDVEATYTYEQFSDALASGTFDAHLSRNAQLASRGVHRSRSAGWHPRPHREASRGQHRKMPGDSRR